MLIVLLGLDTRIFVLANIGDMKVHCRDALSMFALPPLSRQKVIGSLKQAKKSDVDKSLHVKDKVSYVPQMNHLAEGMTFL